MFLPLLGNGPNALSLSYLLSGNEPYYIPHQHPNAILDQKLCEECGKSLLDSVSGNDVLLLPIVDSMNVHRGDCDF